MEIMRDGIYGRTGWLEMTKAKRGTSQGYKSMSDIPVLGKSKRKKGRRKKYMVFLKR